MASKRYISVILPLKLEWEPCYSLPSKISEICVGDRVKVRFANKEYSGVTAAVDIRPETEPQKIKDIISIEDGLERILPEEILLWRAVADYYLCSVGEVYKAAYPHGKINLEEARAAALKKVEARREKLRESIIARISRIEKRIEAKEIKFSKARKESAKAQYSEDIEKALKELETARTALAEVSTRETKEYDKNAGSCQSINLSEAQKTAYDSIMKGFAEGKPVMLNGVTGSGKTEIYIRLAQQCLEKGQNVLYLVPEIALSRQLEDRLFEHFGDTLLTFHSGESAAARRNTAEVVRNADRENNYILLGTRSSLFLPHHGLGLIIVDEEQDSSYKQDSPAPRYNGRDTALMLHKIQGCSIVLGSATPSLEEIYNCQTGKHRLVELTERFHGSEQAGIEIIDTKAERRKNGMKGNFSRKLIAHIERTLEKGQQVIILRSRKAWASVMQCENCGEIVRCPHCNVSLSLHSNHRMVCHYCGYTAAYTGICSKCSGTLKSLGAGTQRIEEEAAALFPQARIARLDSDTAQNRKFGTQTIRDFSSGKIDILIGTQMVAKGFDFSNLSLVAVVAADSLMGQQDFRADEKAFQILEQFRGRCGRRENKGLFVIQTSQPEHPIYQRLVQNEPMLLSQGLLLERKDFSFPPFSRIIEISVKDLYEDRAERMAAGLASDIRKTVTFKGTSLLDDPVTGPYSPAVDKIADQHIRTIRIRLRKDRNLAALKAAVKRITENFAKEHRYDGHITINVDPS